ncbi:sulfur carrier protein ThiS [Algihabitans albus]|uniref:sulfur carrier protein ThiS n=1 Tax=Algihabitans albus TaxID=2164067 RepID=UPI000E5D498D|nr:sulfur carrier protein ThiS [Algihabitans albus]
MKITVNGVAVEIRNDALPAVLEDLGYADKKVATAVNEDFVPAAARDRVTLQPGDRLEIVTPRQGG